MVQKTFTYINQAQKGNQHAFNAIVKEWYPRIYNYSFKYFTSHKTQHSAHDLAMDVCQKTFISVHKNIKKLKEVNRFKPWLYKIATNYCLEELRKAKRKNIIPFVELGDQKEYQIKEMHASPSPDPENITRKSDIQYWVMEALSQIPEEQRLVIIMKEFEGLKFKEIAHTLSVSENTIKSRMYYGLNALKKILTSWELDKEKMLYE